MLRHRRPSFKNHVGVSLAAVDIVTSRRDDSIWFFRKKKWAHSFFRGGGAAGVTQEREVHRVLLYGRRRRKERLQSPPFPFFPQSLLSRRGGRTDGARQCGMGKGRRFPTCKSRQPENVGELALLRVSYCDGETRGERGREGNYLVITHPAGAGRRRVVGVLFRDICSSRAKAL